MSIAQLVSDLVVSAARDGESGTPQYSTETEAARAAVEKAFAVLRDERDAARANHLKVMKQRDAAFSLLDSFRNAHVQEHRWGAGVCHLCLAAEKLTTP